MDELDSRSPAFAEDKLRGNDVDSLQPVCGIGIEHKDCTSYFVTGPYLISFRERYPRTCRSILPGANR